jgi:hypothetical protein
MTCTLTVTVEVYREYNDHEEVKVEGKEKKEATLEKEIETVDECLEILDESDNHVVRMCWNEVKDSEEFEDFSFRSPYARGDVTLHPSTYDSLGVTLDNIVDEIAERDNVEDKAGIYYDLKGNTRIHFNERRILEYLAEERGIDTSYYMHGEST